MCRIVIALVVALLVSGPAWAGSSEINDCETLIKAKLKFPGSYRREHVISANPVKLSFDDEDGTPGKWHEVATWWTAKIEFTARNQNNSVKRNIGKCELFYTEEGFLSPKKLKPKASSAKIQYD